MVEQMFWSLLCCALREACFEGCVAGKTTVVYPRMGDIIDSWEGGWR